MREHSVKWLETSLRATHLGSHTNSCVLSSLGLIRGVPSRNKKLVRSLLCTDEIHDSLLELMNQLGTFPDLQSHSIDIM